MMVPTTVTTATAAETVMLVVSDLFYSKPVRPILTNVSLLQSSPSPIFHLWCSWRPLPPCSRTCSNWRSVNPLHDLTHRHPNGAYTHLTNPSLIPPDSAVAHRHPYINPLSLIWLLLPCEYIRTQRYRAEGVFFSRTTRAFDICVADLRTSILASRPSAG